MKSPSLNSSKMCAFIRKKYMEDMHVILEICGVIEQEETQKIHIFIYSTTNTYLLNYNNYMLEL